MNIREKKGFVCEEDYPVVQTTEGKLRGYVDGDVFCFRGGTMPGQSVFRCRNRRKAGKESRMRWTMAMAARR